jgi:hypothetical protein
MIKLFERKNSKKPDLMTESPVPVEEEHKDRTFEDKFVFIPKKCTENCYPMYENPLDEEIEYFKNGTNVSNAKKVYDSFGLDKYIRRIKIVGELTDAGECLYEIVDGNLLINISIDAHKLGKTWHSKTFADILAHELFHAEDIVRIFEEYGADEVSKIKKSENIMVKLAIKTLSEYKACRGTAYKYNSFDTTLSLSKCLETSHFTLGEAITNFENIQLMIKERLISTIFYLNYVLATFCAFADVSGDKEKDLILADYIKGRNVLMNYSDKLRKTLNEYYNFSTSLTEEMYQSLGEQMMYDLVSAYGVEEDKKNDAIMEILN